MTAHRAIAAVATTVLTLILFAGVSGSSTHGPALVVYGHSYVAGHKGSTDAPWPELVADDLGYRLVNRAHGGDVLADTVAVAWAHDVPGSGAVVILETGLNDVRQYGTDPARLVTFERDLRALVAHLSSRGAEVHVAIDGGLADWRDDGHFRNGSDDAMASYRAAARRAVDVIDLRRGWDPQTMLGEDRVHPNAAGIAALARTIEHALDGTPAPSS